MLYKKNQIKGVCGQLQFAWVADNVYFGQGYGQDMEAGVHQAMEPELFLYIYHERKTEVMCPEKNDVVWNKNQKGMERSFVGYT